jgi:5-hydroxyisourate hydrolase
MSGISTHVLDTAKGRPAQGVRLILERQVAGQWEHVNESITDADGRCKYLLPEGASLLTGIYRITFETAAYFQGRTFYPSVSVVFEVTVDTQHYHVPLLLSPYGYSTYRGS